MPKLVVKVIGSAVATREDFELSRLDSDQYSPDHLEETIRRAVAEASLVAQRPGLRAKQVRALEVSVSLSADERESVRAAVHLSHHTLKVMADAGVGFDFDPYV